MFHPLKILVVEDHKALREVFVDHLSQKGYDTLGVSSGEEVDEYFFSEIPDLLILDINLPGESGLSIGHRYRLAYPALNIIMLTVRAAPADKILGYDNGADIYLAKPVSSEELLAAVASVGRRVQQSRKVAGQASLDHKRMNFLYSNEKINLSQVETILLKALIEASENKLDYWQLIELLDKEPTEKNKSNLGVYVHRLNKKLTGAGMQDPVISSLWKEGYQLNEKIMIV